MELDEFAVSYKPQKISPKFPGTVRKRWGGEPGLPAKPMIACMGGLRRRAAGARAPGCLQAPGCICGSAGAGGSTSACPTRQPPLLPHPPPPHPPHTHSLSRTPPPLCAPPPSR